MMSSMLDEGTDRPASTNGALEADAARYQELQVELELRLLALVDRLRIRIAAVAADLGLTPQQAILLRYLGRPRTTGELAGILGCDPSNVTGLVDRLAARGLIERVVDPADRRVKRLVLTEAGRTNRSRFQERFFAESPATGNLSGPQRFQLLTLLRDLTPDLGEADATLPCAGAGERPNVD